MTKPQRPSSPCEDEAAFFAAMDAAPEDEAPRKIYADWLDEHDRPEEALYYRRWNVLVERLEMRLNKANDYIRVLEADLGGVGECYNCEY